MRYHHALSTAVIASSLIGSTTASARADFLVVSPIPGVAPYQSIQAAVDEAVDGDTILLGAGVYTSDHPRHVVDMSGKGITLMGMAAAENVIIDGEGERLGIACVDGEDGDTIISDLTIRGTPSMSIDLDQDGVIEVSEHNKGSGILCWYSNPIVLRCNFIDNEQGISLWASDATVSKCLFAENYLGARVRGDDDQENPTTTNALFDDCHFLRNNVAMEHVGSRARLEGCVLEYSEFAGILVGNTGVQIPHSHVESHLQIHSSRLHANNSESSVGGAAILMWSGNIHARDTEFSYNHGGGIRKFSCMKSTTLDGCTFIGNHAQLKGGALYSSCGGDFLISNCSFLGNESEQRGGAIDSEKGFFHIVGSTFEGNRAPIGGAIHYQGGTHANNMNLNSRIFVENTLFLGNIATSDGGAIYGRSVIASFAESAFQNNAATRNGGAVYLDNRHVVEWDDAVEPLRIDFNYVTFEENVGLGSGGAIASHGARILLVNCEIAMNAASSGGGVALEHLARVDAMSSEFVDNTAVLTDGGAISVRTDSVLWTESCSFSTNHAAGSGGAIAVDEAVWEEAGSDFLGNQCDLYGGAVESKNNSRIVLSGSSIEGGGLVNAEYGGGIDIDPTNDTAEIKDVTVQGCTATRMGGGIYSDAAFTLIDRCVVSNNHCVLGGGVGSWIGNIEIRNTIICGNTDEQIQEDYVDLGGNVISEVCLAGDLNGDGMIDGADLNSLLGVWGASGGAGDLDRNGIVDGADLMLLLGMWSD